MPLTATEKSLIQAAIKAVTAVPLDPLGFSNGDHNVGSAVLTSTGRIFTGICLSHYTGGPCAEPVAFANAAAAGVDSSTRTSRRDPKREQLVLVVAVAHSEKIISPCGRCRQQMWDYYPGIRVIVKDGEDLRTAGLQELLPFACSVYAE
jgi:cytidine deaminase